MESTNEPISVEIFNSKTTTEPGDKKSITPALPISDNDQEETEPINEPKRMKFNENGI